MFEKSIAPFLRAVETQPTDPTSFTNLATGYYYTGRLPEARDAFEKAVALAPKHAGLRFNLADALHVLGADAEKRKEYEEGIALARAALKVDPADLPTHRQLILAYSRTGEQRRARYHLERALELAPGDAGSMQNAALVALEQGDAAEGRSWLTRAVAAGADPDVLANEPALRPFLSDPEVARIIAESARRKRAK
jgi:Flp pilus assembly protein TadD